MAWLPRLAVMHELAGGGLSRITVDGLQICRTLSVIRLRGAHLSAAAEALVQDVRRALSISPADG
jgi:DNA-binding transcriptional LysR family regulator